MSVRQAVIKAFQTKAAAAAEPFETVGMAAKKTTKRKILRPKVYDRIRKTDEGYIGETKKGIDLFERKDINGKPYMERDDGALFGLRKDGKWTLVARPRRKSGPLTPYIIGGGAAAAAGAAGYEAGRQSRK